MQLWLWLCNSNSAPTTLIVAAQLRLRRHSSLRLPSPHHQPHCTHLPTYCTVLSHACLAYIVVTPSRVFLSILFGFPPARLVFPTSMYYSHLCHSLDFPLLGWVIFSALQGCPYRAAIKAMACMVKSDLLSLSRLHNWCTKDQTKLKAYFWTYFRKEWDVTATKMELVQPLLVLCASHWKAEHMLGNTKKW
jgi:hypothetical protein